MKKIFYLLFIIIPVFTFAQVQIGGAIQQTNPADNYPTHYDSTQFGGFRVLADTFKRNAIKTSYREIGMTVYCTAQNQTYQLIGGVTNNFWVVAGAVAGLSASDTLFGNYKVATYSNIYSTQSAALTIYVDSAAGNDITGNGLIGTPYKTLLKASRVLPRYTKGITIIIQLGLGTYDYTADVDFNLTRYSHLVVGNTPVNVGLQILGASPTLVDTRTFTQSATDNFIYTTTAAYTANQYRNYFTKSGSLYYPIDSNSTNSILVPLNTSSITTLSNIYSFSSKIVFNSAMRAIGGSFWIQNCTLVWDQAASMTIGSNGGGANFGNQYIALISCYIKGTALRGLIFNNCYNSIAYSIIEVNYANANAYALYMRNYLGATSINGLVLRNIATANLGRNGNGFYVDKRTNFNGIGISYGLSISGFTNAFYLNNNIVIAHASTLSTKVCLYVKNCQNIYYTNSLNTTNTAYPNCVNINQYGVLNFNKCDYLFSFPDNVPFMSNKIYYKGKFMAIYNPATTIKTFIDPSNNRYVLVDSQDVSVNSNVTAPSKISVTNGVNIQPSLLTGGNYIFRTISTQPQGIPYSYFQVGQWNKAWLSASIGGWLYMGDKDFTSNYTEYDSTGKFKNYGTALTWDDIVIPGSSFRVGGSAPTFAAYKGGLYLYSFAVNNEVHFSFEIPHDYAEGTNIKFHIHWLLPGLESGTKAVKWELVESHGVVASAYSPISTNSVEVSSSTNYSDISILSDIVTLSGAGISIGTTYVCRIKRITAAGTAPGNDPMIVSIGVHYQQNTNGSFNETSK